MRTQQLNDAREGFDPENPELLYHASVYIALTLDTSRACNAQALSSAAEKVLAGTPWVDNNLLVRRGAKEGKLIEISVLDHAAGDLLQMRTKLSKGQMLAFEKWAEAFAQELLLSEEMPEGVVTSARADVSFKRVFGTYTRAT